MAEILPFIGTRYNSQLIGNLDKVLSPPYDLISPEQQENLYARHEHNVVRLELSKPETGDDGFSNKYTRAANTLKTWRSDGILIEDEKPALYLYEQEFKTPAGEKKKRRGFFALVKLDELKPAGNVGDGDEFSGPKADRLKLMRATKANLSPILVMYADPKNDVHTLLDKQMDAEKAWEQVADEDGVTHRLWVTQRKEFIMGLREALKDKKLFIADGHHRFQTALNFRDEMRQETGKADGKQPFDYMMMFLTSADASSTIIKPTHRVLSRQFMKEVNLTEALEELEEYFEIERSKIDLSKPDAEAKKLSDKLAKLGQKGPAFALVSGDGKCNCLRLKSDADPAEFVDEEEMPEPVKRLDVALLHSYVINQVMVGNPEFELEDDECQYVSDATAALEMLRSKKGALAAVLNGTPADEVIKIVGKGFRLPRKSTHFLPRVISGLVIRNMECEVKKPAKR